MHRHPLSSSFSVYKQCLPKGHSYCNSLQSMATNYRHYAEIMQHFDEVLPGQILTVHYENLVEDTALYTKRILDYCGLEFETSCLEFYKTKRAIRTPSSEQVRQPIYSSAKEHWRNYEEFLEPVKNCLGDLIDNYESTRLSYL